MLNYGACSIYCRQPIMCHHRHAIQPPHVQALQNGLNDLRAWFGYMGCGDAADVDRAFEHVGQAVRYLLVGKDDCVRKAAKGFDVMVDLKRMCPKLTPQQIYRLTEQHHDDWIAGLPGSTSNYTIVLLELLKRCVKSARRSCITWLTCMLRSTRLLSSHVVTAGTWTTRWHPLGALPAASATCRWKACRASLTRRTACSWSHWYVRLSCERLTVIYAVYMHACV